MDAELITRAQNSDFHVSVTEHRLNNDDHLSLICLALVASRFEFFHSLCQLRVGTRCIDDLYRCFYVSSMKRTERCIAITFCKEELPLASEPGFLLCSNQASDAHRRERVLPVPTISGHHSMYAAGHAFLFTSRTLENSILTLGKGKITVPSGIVTHERLADFDETFNYSFHVIKLTLIGFERK